jgi:hypothetical protein
MHGGIGMNRIVPLFLLGEAASFAAAALVHFGVLADGYRAGRGDPAVLAWGLVLAARAPADGRGTPTASRS